MSKLLSYKGYYGSVNYSSEDNILHGKIECITDLVTFEARDVDCIKTEFENAVDDYLETCSEIGKTPDKAFSGSFNIRISPKVHKQLYLEALKKDIKLNQLISSITNNYVNNLDTKLVKIHHEHTHNHIISDSEVVKEIRLDSWVNEKPILQLVN